MAAANGNKVVPYLLVLPSPPPSPLHPSPLSPSSMSSPSSPNQPHKNNRKNRKRNNARWLPATNCCCLLSIFGALLLAALTVASIALPLAITLITSKTKMSSTASTILTTTILNTTTGASTITTSETTTETSTITTSETTTETSTVSTSSIITTTLGTSTTTTTDTPCSPTCSSQQTCAHGTCVGIGYLSCTLTWSRNGDGDIVVATPNNNIICYTNRGPFSATDQGQLDVDKTSGTGPENVFWSNSSSAPPTGTYYVCFSQYNFSPNASSSYPITATVTVVRSTTSTLTFTKKFTSYYKSYSTCDSSSSGLLGSFTYP